MEIVDAYSFGSFLLELLTGRRLGHLAQTAKDEGADLVEHKKPCYKWDCKTSNPGRRRRSWCGATSTSCVTACPHMQRTRSRDKAKYDWRYKRTQIHWEIHPMIILPQIGQMYHSSRWNLWERRKSNLNSLKWWHDLIKFMMAIKVLYLFWLVWFARRLCVFHIPLICMVNY